MTDTRRWILEVGHPNGGQLVRVYDVDSETVRQILCDVALRNHDLGHGNFLRVTTNLISRR